MITEENYLVYRHIEVGSAVAQLRAFAQDWQGQRYGFWSAESIEDALNTNQTMLWVAEKGKVWHGLALIKVVAEDAELLYIHTHSAYRAKGLGRLLLQAVWAELKKQYGVTALFLEVRPQNTAAIRLYERSGFQIIHIRKRYYANGDDALVMQLSKTMDTK